MIDENALASHMRTARLVGFLLRGTKNINNSAVYLCMCVCVCAHRQGRKICFGVAHFI